MSFEIREGDCVATMLEMQTDSIDAVVCDPPYELGFMGKAWDRSGVAYQPETWAQALRVLKPGGHLLAFGGTRTYHRLACAIEDAGFEIRDSLLWLYGSGFPKSLDVSKAIDKAAGVEREIIGVHPDAAKRTSGTTTASGWETPSRCNDLTAPATPEAAEWEGWGTALKPSHEPIVVARKPLAGTVAANVLEHGTGALNVDGCRVAGPKGNGVRGTSNAGRDPDETVKLNGSPGREDFRSEQHEAGRWPANVILSPETADELDEQSGELVSNGGRGPHAIQSTEACNARRVAYSDYDPVESHVYGDRGGASRFFYCAKASPGERNAGITEDRNAHPTVKPIELMRWLCRLVTPPGGTVLDPFAGSGTTGIAATLEGFDFIGCEREAEYAAIARARLEWWAKFPVGTSVEKALGVEVVERVHRETGQEGLFAI